MTELGGEVGLPAQTDEQFVHTVTSSNVIEADEKLWAGFELFLGNDTLGAWMLIEVTHTPRPKVDADGNPTDELELVSTGTWKRDSEVPTPDRVVIIADELEWEEGEEVPE